MSMVGQSRSHEISICMQKLREPMVIRSTFLFSHWNRDSKTDNPVIISSLAFNSETKISSHSLCPTLTYRLFLFCQVYVGWKWFLNKFLGSAGLKIFSFGRRWVKENWEQSVKSSKEHKTV